MVTRWSLKSSLTCTRSPTAASVNCMYTTVSSSSIEHPLSGIFDVALHGFIGLSSPLLSSVSCGPRRPLTLNAVLPEQGADASPMFQIIQPYRMGCFCCPSDVCIGRSYMEVVVNGGDSLFFCISFSFSVLLMTHIPILLGLRVYVFPMFSGNWFNPPGLCLRL